MQELHNMSLQGLALAIKNRAVSARETSEHFLARAKAHASLKPALNPLQTADHLTPATTSCGAFVSFNEEFTLNLADQSDQRISKGQARSLEGVPIAHKDIFVTRDFPTTAGSKMLEGYCSPFDATVVSLLQQEGMINLGKLNCDEFAMGSSNENSAWGPVKNPWDVSRVAGGSSGGSAAAVALRLCPAATGTDTGGSIRQPASFCGVTGIKPTYGRASRYGMIAYASSLDQAGPMAQSAEDCALLLSAMCGPDLDRDSTSLDVPKVDFSRHLNDSIQGLRIGLPKEFFSDGLHADVRTCIDLALHEFKALGAQLVPIELPKTELSIPVYYILAPAEASSNLSRFDGVKFGFRAKTYKDLDDL